MVISDFFRDVLDAPFRNVRWSWGAERADGVVIFRVWADEVDTLDGGDRAIRLADKGSWGVRDSHPGWRERLRHIGKVQAGAPAVAVLCRKRHPTARPRKIASFDTSHVVPLTAIIEKDGDVLGVLGQPIAVSSLPALAVGES